MAEKLAIDPTHGLEYTGERYHPEVHGEIRQEHLHRYEWCIPFVKGKDVLDIACGEGFGSAILGRQAQSVIGVDVSQEAVDHANQTYGSDKVRFVHGDIEALDFEAESFDLVVSFETIEHISKQSEAIDHLYKVLRPGGLLIMSSPNPEIYTEKQGHLNEFHVNEISSSQFDDLVSSRFEIISKFGQRMVTTSLLFPMDNSFCSAVVLQDNGSSDILSSVKSEVSHVNSPMYYLIMASKSTKTVLNPPASFLMSGVDDIYWEYRDQIVAHRKEIVAHRNELENFVKENGRLLKEQGILKQLAYLHAVSSTGFFDSTHYSRVAEVEFTDEIQAFSHYLLYGEHLNLTPSDRFDPRYYRVTYPDVPESGLNLLVHFVTTGQQEGRLGLPGNENEGKQDE